MQAALWIKKHEFLDYPELSWASKSLAGELSLTAIMYNRHTPGAWSKYPIIYNQPNVPTILKLSHLIHIQSRAFHSAKTPDIAHPVILQHA